jgi:hypothetical protein
VEDALEIEFRSDVLSSSTQLGPIKGAAPLSASAKSSGAANSDNSSVPSVTASLAEIVTDTDLLFKVENIRALLPRDFPTTRNPFMLGKPIDELACLLPPHSDPGNKEAELKVYPQTLIFFFIFFN